MICPNLRDFDHFIPSMSDSAYTSLLLRYGPQVRQAAIWEGFELGTCVKILESCSNVRFSYQRAKTIDNLDYVHLVAPRQFGSFSFCCVGLCEKGVEKLTFSLMERMNTLSALCLILHGS